MRSNCRAGTLARCSERLESPPCESGCGLPGKGEPWEPDYVGIRSSDPWADKSVGTKSQATSIFSFKNFLSASSMPDNSNEFVIVAFPFSTLVMT
jgi:hypothetical protein